MAAGEWTSLRTMVSHMKPSILIHKDSMMNHTDERQLLEWLVQSQWLDIIAMPVQKNRNVLLDIVFSTNQAQIVLTGKAHSLTNGSEAFSLAIYVHRQEG